MSSTDTAELNAFRMGDRYWFAAPDVEPPGVATFFDRTAGRYEVPDRWMETVVDRFDAANVRLVRVTDPRPFCVIVEDFGAFGSLFRGSIGHWRRRSDRVFLLPDRASVRDAIDRGATPLARDADRSTSTVSTPSRL